MNVLRSFFRDRSFAYKFTLLSTIPVIIVAVFIALLATRTLEQSVTEATNVRVKQNTYLAALSISNPYAIYNKALLDSFVESLGQEKDILYAYVVDYNDGRILSHSDHTKDGLYDETKGSAKIQIIGTGMDGIAHVPGVGYEAVSPIHIAGDLFGSVKVGFTLDSVYRDIALLRMKIAMITFLAVAFSVFLSVFLARLLGRPILALANQAQKVAEGHFELDITYESQDVVGRLSNAFKKMTEELRERLHLILTSEKKYRSLFEASNDAVLILDGEKIIDCNQQTFRLFKCGYNDIVWKSFDHLSPDRQPSGSLSRIFFQKRLEEVLSGQNQRFYWKHVRFDQTELDAEVSLSSTMIQDKKMILTVVQDITERKAAEAKIEQFNRTLEMRVKERTKELQDAQNAMMKLIEDLNRSKTDLERSKQDLETQKVYLEQLFEASPEAIVHVDQEGQVVRINRPFTEIFGFSETAIKGKSLDLLIIPDFKREESTGIKDSVAIGQFSFHETQRQRQDKSLVDVSLTGMPIIIDGLREGAYIIYRDISARKRAEKELKKARETAEFASRAKGEFLANMSHEIRTPLNAIIGLTYLARQTSLSRQQHEYLQKIDSSAGALLAVINDILDFSKIEAGKLTMESSEFYLEDVLGNVSDMLAMNADEKGLELIFTTDSNIPQELVGDPLRLGQVLINLVGNAIKFTEKGEVVVHTRLVEDQGERVLLKFQVRDTGIGLSRIQRSKLFKAFSQADTSITRKFGGTGLGLVICKRIVEMMGGGVELESEHGKGSIFSFTALLGRHHKTRLKPSLLADDFKGMRALVVDDSQTARQTLKWILESLNLEVTSASSGQEAIKILECNAAEGKKFDMVFTDFKMPVMDGLETARQIKNISSLARFPILIMVSAYGREEVLKKAEQLGLDGFISKPVSPSMVLDSMMMALGKEVGEQRKGRLAQPVSARGLAAIEGGKILLVEDNEINQQVACELLLSFGLEVRVAENGKVALEMLQKEPFDAVLMDVQMPVMDGLAAAQEIRALKSDVKEIPIVALTAHAMSGDREKSIQAGMNDHITKPLDPEKLALALIKWVKPVMRPAKKGPSLKGGESTREKADLILPEMPGIDVDSAMARVGGDPKVFIGLIQKFGRRHAGAADEIETLLGAGNTKKALESAHALKGVSGTIGAVEVQRAAERLERAIEENQIERYESLLESTRTRLNRVLASIRRLDGALEIEHVHTSEHEKRPLLDMVKIEYVLSDLNKLLKSNDYNSVKSMESLESLLKGTRTSEKLTLLKKLVEGYRFKEALEKLDALAQDLKNNREGEGYE